MPGKPFSELCQSLSFDVKVRLVRELAASSACLFRNQLRGIKNIYGKLSLVERSTSSEKNLPYRELVDAKISDSAKESESDDGSAAMGKNLGALLSYEFTKAFLEGTLPAADRIVSMQFFWDSHIRQDVHRGRFRSSKDWIIACLSFSENECHSALNRYSAGELDSDAEDEAEGAKITLQTIENLESLLPLVFRADSHDLEPSMIFHDEISRHSLLLDDSGKLAGLLD
ncbi:hypothetical protein PENCOP_c001G08627 [Penicillium coprophilum]|uniref:Uncharacterized protein n=1 Tax=Penicillium coprophilum TaxID=36646 RepID=A0A1V6V626_9EURO|nr:hypothetical protein PENCOP_c001G08627 [Penicillium coprophilum]